MLKFVIVASVLCLYYLASVEAISGWTIANKADSYEHNTKWSYASSHDTGRNTNKCNIFINDVMEAVGGSVPQRRWWHSPIGAGEWGNPSSSYLSGDSCWNNVRSPSIGDVMGDGVHVAFYTGYRTTTSARSDKIVKNSWGFRSTSGSGSSSNSYAYWRYVC